ncbi:MAG: quinone-dependent dihydroorotate dehydrogenase [Alphaproteobacteria bacterium]|nr:quinone-dependent dihydroorotate dehydrogenase [Alphaproteobacteria bacterium]
MHYYKYLSPVIFRFSPEVAHNLALHALKHGFVPPQRAIDHPALRMQVGGVSFRNPLGLAAGFDKNGEVAAALFDQGFGFIEAGSVTPQPQEGNAKPRMFRLREDEALINRLGFNNEGVDAVKLHLAKQRKRLDKARLSGGALGVNIGKNKTSEDAVADYLSMFDAVSGIADYITVNISSPNTEGLRDLQEASALGQLLDALCNRREQLSVNVPLWLKIAPDLTDEQSEAVAQTVKNYPIDALVISNTTTERPASLIGQHKAEQGGLSGKPLMIPSTARLRLFYKLVGDQIPLVGVGGIASAEDAYAKIRAGASLVQLYTALAYQGFGLVRDINAGLLDLLKQDGYSHIKEAIGAHAK